MQIMMDFDVILPNVLMIRVMVWVHDDPEGLDICL